MGKPWVADLPAKENIAATPSVTLRVVRNTKTKMSLASPTPALLRFVCPADVVISDVELIASFQAVAGSGKMRVPLRPSNMARASDN